MADTLIVKLSGVSNSSCGLLPLFAERRAEQDSITAGRELGVDFVLEGHLQMVGDKTRATVRLLSVKDGTASGRINATINAQPIRIAGYSRRTNSRGARAAPDWRGEEATAKHYTENPEAYQLYLKGRYFWNKRTEDGLREASSISIRR